MYIQVSLKEVVCVLYINGSGKYWTKQFRLFDEHAVVHVAGKVYPIKIEEQLEELNENRNKLKFNKHKTISTILLRIKGKTL